MQASERSPALVKPAVGVGVGGMVMSPLDVVLEVAQLRAPVVAVRAGIGLLPRVSPQVAPQVFQLPEVLAAHGAAVLGQQLGTTACGGDTLYQHFPASALSHLRYQEKR